MHISTSSATLQQQSLDVLHQGFNLHREGKLEEAEALYRKALELYADNYAALSYLGTLQYQKGQAEEAVACMRRSLQMQPKQPDTHNNLGVMLLDLQRPAEALQSFDAALALDPKLADVLGNRGNALYLLGEYQQALVALEQAIALNSRHVKALFNHALVLQRMGRVPEALTSYDRVLVLEPRYMDAWNNRGDLLRELGQHAEALASYDQVLGLSDLHPEVWHKRGLILQRLQRVDEALQSYSRAVQLRPEYGEAWNNRGTLYQEIGCFDLAMQDYDRAIELDADFAQAHLNKSMLQLLLGNFAEGWARYEWRHKLHKPPLYQRPVLPFGQNVAGKIILVPAEQRLGDFIQFCRYTSLLLAEGARVILEVPASLMRVASALPLAVRLVEAGQPLPEFDFYCPLMSLPRFFGTTVETIPNRIPYLFTPGTAISSSPAPSRMRIGVVWSGSTLHKKDHARSITLADFMTLFDFSCEFHVLQKEISPDDLKLLSQCQNVYCHQQELLDFADTAALVHEMDLIISVDTALAHLAGAMGKPVWILLPMNPDFRWLLHQSNTPWYPQARLFRQAEFANWVSVLGDVADALVVLQGAPDAVTLQREFQEALRLHESGDLDAAKRGYEKVLSVNPCYSPALTHMGTLAYQRGDLQTAVRLLQNSIKMQPLQADAHNHLGVLLHEMKQHAEAMAAFDRAITLAPDLMGAYRNRAHLLQDLQQYERALADYDQALALNMRDAEILYSRGLVLEALQRYTEAMVSYSHAIQLDPHHAPAYHHRGNTWKAMGDWADAIADYTQVIVIHPDCAQAYRDRGFAFQCTHQLAAALQDYDRAIELDANDAMAYWGKAQLLLLCGKFGESWPLYEWRYTLYPQRDYLQPLWQGEESLRDRTILLYEEQSYGETIQFVRYVSLLSEQGARVLLEVRSALASLFATLSGNITIVLSGQTIPHFECHCPLSGLPLAFRTELATIPAHVPYLQVPESHRSYWQLPEVGCFRAGLVWSGEMSHGHDSQRSLRLQQLDMLWQLPVEFHALQPTLRADDLPVAQLIRNLQLHTDQLKDFLDTAALIQQMDLVIAVDTAVAHLAGALGKPVWILLPYANDPRWLFLREDSPWYPSARLFRQPKMGDWESVIATVARALNQKLFSPEAVL